jgi:hypothetical protein
VVGVPDLGAAGATLMRAALIYQQATHERDRQIADRLSTIATSSTPPTADKLNAN